MAEERREAPTVPLRPGGRGPGGPGRGMPVEKAKDAKGTIKKLVAYVGSNKYLVITLIVIMLATTLLSLAAPSLQGMAIDKITLDENTLHIDKEGLISTLVILLLTYLVSSALTYIQGITAAKLSQSTVKKMRQDLFSKIEYLPIKYVDTHKHGDIMSRMTNDVENISNTISQSIASLFSGVITLIGCFAIMLYYSPLLTFVSMITIVFTVITTKYMTKFMRKYFPEQQRILGRVNGHVEEMVSGYKTVIAFGKEEKSQAQFNELSQEYKVCAIKAQAVGGCMGPLMNVIGNLSFLIIAGFGGWLAIEGVITIGIIQAFILYSKQFTRPINEIANQYASIQTAIACAERVFEIIDAEPELDAGKADFKVENVKGNIEFKDIKFSYVPNEPVLKGFNLDVKSGQKIAIVGATGSGKTTVVNLLTRFYDVDSGTIKLDGVNINDIPKETLRKSIAIVLQDTIIFSDTIAANIRYGNLNATDEDIKKAAVTANVDKFAEKLTDGYNTMLTENGSNLSQGQRQLISIARAVLADPKILILDEATSSIDTRTEMHIQNAMISLMKGRTSLIIAHRLSTIRDADIIVVIDKGVVAEAGSHEELLKQKGCYYNLYQNQFAGIET